jgi:hypothetical protein
MASSMIAVVVPLPISKIFGGNQCANETMKDEGFDFAIPRPNRLARIRG